MASTISNSNGCHDSTTLLQGGIDLLMLLLHMPLQVIVSIEALTMMLARCKRAVEPLLRISIVSFPVSSEVFEVVKGFIAGLADESSWLVDALVVPRDLLKRTFCLLTCSSLRGLPKILHRFEPESTSFVVATERRRPGSHLIRCPPRAA